MKYAASKRTKETPYVGTSDTSNDLSENLYHTSFFLDKKTD